MMYTLSMQYLNLKYIVLWATKKQNLTRFEGALVTHPGLNFVFFM
jgi:hypothetical protein